MLNNTKALIERETVINYKILTVRLPLVLIALVLYIIFPSYLANEKNILIILGISINLLFAMIFFPQIYLQELEGKEIKFLFTFLVERNKIILSKAIYILITVLFLNLILMVPEYLLFNNLVYFLNVFISNIMIGVFAGIVFLKLFLTTTYENFQNIILYVHEIIIAIFFALVSLIKTNLWNINSIFNINPIFSIAFLILSISASVKLLQIVFNNIS